MPDSRALEIERLLRDCAPRVLASVARRAGDFSSAEDAVQEALWAASVQWPKEGVPDHPHGWLVQVALRRRADQARVELARRRRESFVVMQPDPPSAADPEWIQSESDDDTLVLLFLCCHPALTRSSQIAVTLRALGGLSTAEIASAYLVPEATMAQRISRAKATIQKSGVGFEMPDAGERRARLDAVLHVLYLIFNEGYATSSGRVSERADLCREAIRLARLVRELLPEEPEVTGLLSLLLLTDARRAARTDARGELVPLDEQNRTLWDREKIAEGVALVSDALPRGQVGPYRIQAAIAALHDEAASAGETDWPQILALYGLLLHMTKNPMVLLNHAVALAMVHGPRAGLDRLEALDADPRVAEHHRLAAVRAHLLEKAGDARSALAQYRLAAERTASSAERTYLLLRVARLEHASKIDDVS